MLDVGHGGGVVGSVPPPTRTKEVSSRPMAQVLFKRLRSAARRALAVGGHGVVDRVPVTGQFGCHLFDRASVADLALSPTWPPGSSAGTSWPQCGGRLSFRFFFEQRSFTQRIRCFFHASASAPVDGQIHVMDHRTVPDRGSTPARCSTPDPYHLFDHQLDVATAPFVVQDPHVFQTHQRLSISLWWRKDEGAFWFLGHTSSLKHLRRARGDPGQGRDPPGSDEPTKTRTRKPAN